MECDKLIPPDNDSIEYFVDCLNKERQPEGPLHPEVCRIGQAITEAVKVAIKEERTVSLNDIL